MKKTVTVGPLKNKLVLAFLSVIILAVSCQQDEKRRETKSSAKQVKINVPSFNQDSAYHFIEKQVGFGPRVPGTEGHEKCAEYLTSKMKAYADNVIVQEAEVEASDGKMLQIKNIIGSFNTEMKNRVLLFAHWDTRPTADRDTADTDKPILGANDGGSGVGVLLETARQFSIKKPNVGVDIIFFDAEDYGEAYCLGSQYWAKNPHKNNYFANYGILLDMVGAKDALFTMEHISMYYAPSVMKNVWNIASNAGYSDYFSYMKTNFVGADDHLYVNKIANIPSIDIIQYDPATGEFGSYHHRHTDNMDIIDRATLKAVGQTVLEVVYRE